MTGNQLAYQANKEKERSNIANETETKRSNKAKEFETSRSNLRREMESERHNRAQESIGRGSNVAKLFSGTVKAINDPSWYNKDPQLVKDAASFSFATPLGSTLDIADKTIAFTADGSVEQERKLAVPGIMALKYASSLPDPRTMKNIADKFYAEVRRANSGSRNYESNDLMMYLLAVCEAFSQLTHAARIYSLAQTYKARNFYYAKGYLRSIGFNDTVIDQLINNAANYRTKLNILIRRINSLVIPEQFPIFQRKTWLNSHIFKDHEVTRSSNYMFVPAFIYIFNESDHSELKATSIDYSSIDNYLSQLEDMINAIFYSEDLGIMSGDIQKAFPNGWVSMNEIPEDFHIEESYEAEVLSQINASTVVGQLDPTYSTIFTYTNSISSFIAVGNPAESASATNGLRTVSKSPVLVGNSNIIDTAVSSTIVNMYKDEVTPDDVMVATRLQCSYLPTVALTPGTKPTSYWRAISNTSLEVISQCTIVVAYALPSSANEINFYTIENLYDGVFVSEVNGNYLTSITPSNNINSTHIITKSINTFDWAPRLRLLSSRSGTSATSLSVITYDNLDFANYMILESDRLHSINTVAFLSLFDL